MTVGGPDDGALFAVAQIARDAGAVELATARSLRAAELDGRDEGAGAALLATAWAIDAARAAGKFYGVAQAVPAYLDGARALGLTLDGRKATEAPDGVAAWLATVTDPT